jgi:DNA-binding MarR family transcriptional regulator
MENVPFELVLGGGSLVQRVGRRLHVAVTAQLAPFDITAQQAAVLLHATRGQTSPNQLAPLIGTDTAGMTRLLDRLEDKGFIRRGRHLEDRRSIVIEVTEEGRAVAPLLAPVFGRVNTQMLDGFSEKEIRQLTRMLQRMLDNLDATGTNTEF